MKSNEPVYIIRLYFKNLNKYAGRLRRDFDEETIHLFRVDVKKLRAFLRMIRTGIKEPGQLKFPRKFKKMYSLTGKIRDRQLCIKRIKEHEYGKNHKLRSKVAAIEKELKELTDKRDNLLDKKEFSEIEEKIIAEVPGIPEDILIKNFFLQKLNGINEAVTQGDYKDKELHSIRKNIKDTIYIMRVFRDDCKSGIPFSFWNKTELKNAEDLSHTLGLFNDACIALSFILPAEIKKADPEEKVYLWSVRRKWLEEKRKLKKEILNRIQGLKLDLP